MAILGVRKGTNKPNQALGKNHTVALSDTWESVPGIPSKVREIACYSHDNSDFQIRTTADDANGISLLGGRGFDSGFCDDLLYVEDFQVKGVAGTIIVISYIT